MISTLRIADELRAALRASGREIAIEWAEDDSVDDTVNIVNERFHLQVGQDYVRVVEEHYDNKGDLKATTTHGFFNASAFRSAIRELVQLMG